MKPALVSLLLPALLIAPLASAPQSGPQSQAECTEFGPSRQLLKGDRFVSPLPRNLEFRLEASPDRWHIRVGPRGRADDYLAVVNPPYQTRPQLQIGPGYGLTAEESARLSPREFRFVLSEADWREAGGVADRLRAGTAADGAGTQDLSRLGSGALTLTIWEFSLDPDRVALAWIVFGFKACVPR